MNCSENTTNLALVSDGSARRLILRKEVQRRTGLPQSTLYEMIKKGTFCQPVRLTPRLIAFVETEVDTWIAERIAKRAQRPAV